MSGRILDIKKIKQEDKYDFKYCRMEHKTSLELGNTQRDIRIIMMIIFREIKIINAQVEHTTLLERTGSDGYQI